MHSELQTFVSNNADAAGTVRFAADRLLKAVTQNEVITIAEDLDLEALVKSLAAMLIPGLKAQLDRASLQQVCHLYCNHSSVFSSEDV